MKWPSSTCYRLIWALLLLGAGSLYAQPFAGTWLGNLMQTEGGFTTNYSLRVELKHAGNKVEGTSAIQVTNMPRYYALMAFTGEITDGIFHFRETRIIEQNIPDGWYWCLKEGQLKVDTTGKEWKFTGIWRGAAGFAECSPGNVELSKPAPVRPRQVSAAPPPAPTLQGRSLQTQQSLNVSTTSVDIYVWDADAIDGDSISLSLNGKWVLESYKLSGGKKKITLQLQPGKANQLVLHALNVGRIPPNTAAVSVFDGKEWHNLKMKSDMKTSGMLELRVSP